MIQPSGGDFFRKNVVLIIEKANSAKPITKPQNITCAIKINRPKNKAMVTPSMIKGAKVSINFEKDFFMRKIIADSDGF